MRRTIRTLHLAICAFGLGAAAAHTLALGPAQYAYRTMYGQSGDGLGFKAVGIGDYNGDGVSDYAVSLLRGQSTGGSVNIYSGADGSIIQSIVGPQITQNLFGNSIAGAGDVNHDGYADILIGSPIDLNVDDHVSPPIISMHSSVEIWSGATHQRLLHVQGSLFDLGWSTANAGDVDGDGTPDFVTGGPSAGNGGHVAVYSGADGTPLYVFNSTGSGELGFAVDGAGDVNGDGFDDVIAGDPYYGNVLVIDAHNETILYTLSAGGGGFFGGAVANAGDLNHDDVDEIFIGAKNSNRAYVYDGASGSLLRTFLGPAHSYFGYSVSSAGDFNHDGVPDLAVGATNFAATTVVIGRAYVYSGATGGAIQTFNGPGGNSYFGMSLGNAGDVNGDGFDDLLIGAPGYYVPGNYGNGASGAAYLCLGLETQLGSFPTLHQNAATDNPAFALLAKLDHSGYSKLVSIDPTSSKMAIQSYLPSGLFGSPQLFEAGKGATSVVAVDINHDQNQDLAIAATGENKIVFYRSIDDYGNFWRDGATIVGRRPRSVITADFNHDARADIAFVNQLDNKVSVMLNNNKHNFALSKQFAARKNYNVGVTPMQVQAADMNGDTSPDLVVINATSSTISILLNKGDGKFFAAKTFACGAHPVNFAIADLDQDGAMDVVLATKDGLGIEVYKGDGAGGLNAPTTISLAAAATSIVARDLTADGWVDLAIASRTGDAVYLLINDSHGSFGEPATYESQGNPAWMTSGDIDQDGAPDLLTVNRQPANMTILSNQWVGW